MGNLLGDLFGVNTQDVQQGINNAQTQLTQAFTILIVEGALAVVFLALIYTRLKH